MTDEQARLLLEMIQWAWQGDPELVTDAHWQAFNEVAAAIGYEVPE